MIYLLFVLLEKPLYEVCLIPIKEQVHKKMSAFGTHRNADYVKNMSNKHNLKVINHKLWQS
jgi:hypothetical protein